MSRADPAAIWAELMGKISRIRGGATPEQQYQISKNAQDIHVLYGVTESIQDLIPEGTTINNPLVNDDSLDAIRNVIPAGTSVSDPLVKRSQVPGASESITYNIPDSVTDNTTLLSWLYSVLDPTKITARSSIRLKQTYQGFNFDNMFMVSSIDGDNRASSWFRCFPSDVELVIEMFNSLYVQHVRLTSSGLVITQPLLINPSATSKQVIIQY